MNSHLNVFKTYTRENRNYQLENDLTRALAICMQEDALLLHEVLKRILGNDVEFDLMFANKEANNDLKINIQVAAGSVPDFSTIYAVSLTDFKMTDVHFWNQNNNTEYDPICDVVITINDKIIVIETKRDASDCTAQLYNQCFNILKAAGKENEIRNIVKPVDLNWKELMKVVSRVLSFQNTVDNVNRFTSNFYDLVKGHNVSWLPIMSISHLQKGSNRQVLSRIDASLSNLETNGKVQKLTYNDRIGVRFNQPWAQELLFKINDNGGLSIDVYPGNTKTQGGFIFNNNYSISENLTVSDRTFKVYKGYHIKFTSFQRYFTGMWFYDSDLKEPGLYTKENYHKYTGRNIKSNGDWDKLEVLFDKHFTTAFNWRKHTNWSKYVLGSGKTQFDMSFGYGLSIHIPFEELQKHDTNVNSIESLADYIYEIYHAFNNDLIK